MILRLTWIKLVSGWHIHHGMRATRRDTYPGTPGNQSLCSSSSSLRAR